MKQNAENAGTIEVFFGGRVVRVTPERLERVQRIEEAARAARDEGRFVTLADLLAARRKT